MKKRTPKCRCCNKVLQELFISIYGPPEQPHTVIEGVTSRECTGAWIKVEYDTYECSECPARYPGKRIGKKGTGRFGYKGDGLFCTLRCGYYYAVKVVQRESALRDLA